MRSFRLLDRLLGRRNEQFVPGECLSALNASMKTGQVWIIPEGAVVVPSPAEPKYPEAERIAASIRDFPEDWGWERKGFDLIHIPSGFRLWVGNEGYGLAEVHPNNGKTDFTKPEQAIIWPAVADWLGHRKVGFTGRLPKARITGRHGTFWCFAKEHPWAGVGDSPEEAYRAWRHAISAQARSDMRPNEYLQVRSASL
ncbi:hypothetical protein CQ006_12445 [Pseudomonas cedrina]|uniref:Uncharacterized protein n=1 Tax=Pseudomonas cedrina TaxID=651740 RepID=A0A2S9DR93_PSECE|nr:hypothetical protein CLM72_06290 [Pseudomonas sp. MYb193]PRC05121.1 hypothetical protein CQ006_12445 [Pseudomonas cedrina]